MRSCSIRLSSSSEEIERSMACNSHKERQQQSHLSQILGYSQPLSSTYVHSVLGKENDTGKEVSSRGLGPESRNFPEIDAIPHGTNTEFTARDDHKKKISYQRFYPLI